MVPGGSLVVLFLYFSVSRNFDFNVKLQQAQKLTSKQNTSTMLLSKPNASTTSYSCKCPGGHRGHKVNANRSRFFKNKKKSTLTYKVARFDSLKKRIVAHCFLHDCALIRTKF